MADNNEFNSLQGLGSLTNPITQANQSIAQNNATSSNPNNATSLSNKNQIVNQQQFLTLLVNQLQHQDPLNPMDSTQFTAQLAQFSQLEQLVQINGKLSNSSGLNSVSSMASFLGYEVVLKGEQVQVTDARSSGLAVNFPDGVQSARVDFLDTAGKAVGSQVFDQVAPGKQVLSPKQLSIPDGTYDVRVTAVDGAGQFVNIDPKVTGTVEGFVLEPKPALLVNGAEVSLDNVVEVLKATKNI